MILGNILNKPDLICLHTVRCFKYCYPMLIVLSNVCLHKVSKFK